MNLGRYEVIRELGKGAMGVVYLAEDPVIGRRVAIKTIQISHLAADDEKQEFQERFRREAQAAGRLSHPAIVTVFDAGWDAKSACSFIAMEYIEGTNLKEVVASKRRWSPAKSAEMLARIAEGLDYAHERGVIHRDVKPANIIVGVDGSTKITDFGIAKLVSGRASLTTTGQLLGTPNYMAPEQIRATAKVDGRADIFSLGVVLYELLSGAKPFSGDSLTSVSFQIVYETYKPLREVDENIPDVFETIVSRCLQKNPDLRYRRARDLAKHLRAAAAGTPLPEVHTSVDEEQALPDQDYGANDRIETVNEPFSLDEGNLPSLGPDDETITTTDRGDPLGNAVGTEVTGSTTGIRRPVSRRIFYSVSGLALLGVLVVSTMIWQRWVEVPAIDSEREARVAAQSAIRREAVALMERGDVDGALEKYNELARLAPESPQVQQAIESLERIRDEREEADRRAREAGARSAMLLTQFDHSVADGTLEVIADGEIIVREDLWRVRRVALFRRRVPRDIAVYSQLTGGQHEVRVIVLFPSIGISFDQTRTIDLSPDHMNRLVITMNDQERRVGIEFR